MPDLDVVRTEIERMRIQVGRQRKEILQLQRANISTATSPTFSHSCTPSNLRHQATREGWCRPHVEAIIVAIDQYAEAATGNREYFLNKPVSIGGKNVA